MSGVIREVCALSILCGVAMSIMPEGSVKRVAGILCSAVIITALVAPLKEFDFDDYARMLSQYRSREASLSARGDEISERLCRTVIEDECSAYIMDKADVLGVAIKEARVEVQWNTEGVWVPYSACIAAEVTSEQKKALEDKLAAELGIPPERVQWISDG